MSIELVLLSSSLRLLHNNRTYQTLDSGKPFASPPSVPGSLSADIGLLHPAYARQSIGEHACFFSLVKMALGFEIIDSLKSHIPGIRH